MKMEPTYHASDPVTRTKTMSYSMGQKWRECRRLYYYRYIGQTSTSGTMPLFFGSLVHKALELELLNNKRIQEDPEDEKVELLWRKNHLETFVESRMMGLEDLVKEWQEELLEPFDHHDSGTFGHTLPTYSPEDVEKHAELFRGMMRNWLHFTGVSDLENYKVWMVEPVMEGVPFRNFQTGKMSRRFQFVGMCDAILIDKKTGRFILREYKTTSASDARQLERKATIDPQVKLYATMLERAGMTFGEPISEVQYVALRKKIPRGIATVKCRSCKGSGEKKNVGTCPACRGRGNTLSTSRNVDTTQEKARESMAEQGFNPDDFEDFLSRLPGPEKFVNVSTHYLSQEDKTEAEIETFAAAQEAATAVRRYAENKSWESVYRFFPRNTSKCTGPGGFCAFKDVCSARIDAETLHELGWKRVCDHPELSEE